MGTFNWLPLHVLWQHVSTHTHTHVYIYIYIYTHTHLYIYTLTICFQCVNRVRVKCFLAWSISILVLPLFHCRNTTLPFHSLNILRLKHLVSKKATRSSHHCSHRCSFTNLPQAVKLLRSSFRRRECLKCFSSTVKTFHLTKKWIYN